MKLVRRGLFEDSWQLSTSGPKGNEHMFCVDGYGACHIQKKPTGEYGFNAAFDRDPLWVGPTFATLEEALLWAMVTGATNV